MAVLTEIFTLILWVVLIVVILPFTPIFLFVIICRQIEELICKHVFQYERINSDAVIWMFDSVKNHSIINGSFIMEKKFPIEYFRKLAQKRWIDLKDTNGQVKYPNLVKYLHTGILNYYWKPENNFDLNRHVYEWSQHVFSKDECERLLNELSTRPFIRAEKLSPWEMILIHFKDNDDKTKSCLFIRTNHSLGDGVSIVYCIVNYMSDEPAKTLPVPKIPRFLETFMKIKGYFHIPLQAFKTCISPVPSHNLHCTNASGKKNVACSEPISLPLIKAIKNKLRVTINDVLVGCIATNFHQLLKRSGKSVPPDVTASLPFDTRFSAKEAETFNNKFAVLLFQIPTESENTLQNIQTVRSRMNRLKISAENISARSCMRLTNYCLPYWIAQCIHSAFTQRSTLVLSNVAGPTHPLKFSGIPVEQMCFWPPGKDNIGMTLALLSYNNKVTITFYCDNALNGTAKELLAGLPDVFNELAESIGLENIQNFD